MTNSTHSSSTSLFKASPYTESSSKCSRSAKGSHFVKALERSNIDLTRCEDPKVQEIKRTLDLMERPRESPAPDSEFFHQTRRTILHENKTLIMMELSPLLLVLRKLPSNIHKPRICFIASMLSGTTGALLNLKIFQHQNPIFTSATSTTRLTQTYQSKWLLRT